MCQMQTVIQVTLGTTGPKIILLVQDRQDLNTGKNDLSSFLRYAVSALTVLSLLEYLLLRSTSMSCRHVGIILDLAKRGEGGIRQNYFALYDS